MGDGNNIVHSWIRLAAAFDFDFVCACPEGYEPDPATVALADEGGAGRVSISHDASEVQTRTITPPALHVLLRACSRPLGAHSKS